MEVTDRGQCSRSASKVKDYAVTLEGVNGESPRTRSEGSSDPGRGGSPAGEGDVRSRTSHAEREEQSRSVDLTNRLGGAIHEGGTFLFIHLGVELQPTPVAK